MVCACSNDVLVCACSEDVFQIIYYPRDQNVFVHLWECLQSTPDTLVASVTVSKQEKSSINFYCKLQLVIEVVEVLHQHISYDIQLVSCNLAAFSTLVTWLNHHISYEIQLSPCNHSLFHNGCMRMLGPIYDQRGSIRINSFLRFELRYSEK